MDFARETVPNNSARLAWVIGLALVAAGCQNSVYRPANLPPELLMNKVDGLHKVDLTRLAQTSVPSQVIYVGDVLEVTIATGLEDRSPPSWPLRVADSGEINIPLVGPVRVAGLMLTDAEQAIRHESVARRIYRDPNVAVLLKQRKTIRVTVVGAVTKAGTYELPAAGGDLLAALIAAGGLKETASTIVEIRNVQDPAGLQASYNGQRTTLTENDSVRIDLIAAAEGVNPDYRIQDGSIVMVREQEPTTVQVIGLVRKPDQFEVPPDQSVRLLDAIALAGGLSIELADKVQVIRQLDDMDEPVVIQCSVRDAKRGGKANLLLAPGDVVSVEETPLTFTVGTIQSFVRFGFSSAIPGM
ncbi:MAG: polysaccharide export protein [Planctomycetes bacterium]|nr:polysaccharide export protein [Planctomycetota bacterium]